MQDRELYEKLLGLKGPWFVEKVILDLSAACVIVLIVKVGFNFPVSCHFLKHITPPSSRSFMR